MNKFLRLMWVVYVALAPSGILHSQQLENNRVVYTGFEPKLAEVEKITTSPQILDTIRLQADTNYALNVKSIPTYYTPDTLAAARMRKEPISRLQRAMLKLGFGNYTSPLIDFHLNSLRARNNGYFVRFNHLSSTGSISGRGFPGTSSNTAEAGYRHIFKRLTLGIEGGYDRLAVHYYGYPQTLDSLFPSDSTRQRYSLGHGRFYLNSTHRTDSIRLNYSTSLDFYHVSNLYRTRENTFRLKTNLNKFTDLFAGEFLGVNASLDVLDFSSDSLNMGLGWITDVNPYMRLGRKNWDVELGAALVFGNSDSSFFKIYPRIHANWKIFKQYVQLFGGVAGDFERFTFRELYTQNPFIQSNVSLTNQNTPYRLHAGIKGAFSDLISYRSEISYARINGMPFFVNDTLGAPRTGFEAIYDQANLTTISAGLNFHYGEKMEVDLQGRYRLVSLSNLNEAWHFPPLDIRLAARYQLGEKMLFKADLAFISGQRARVFNQDSTGAKTEGFIDLNPTFDVRLGATYRLTEKLGFFLDMNNVAAFRYNRFYGYPTFGFTIIGGLRLSL